MLILSNNYIIPRGRYPEETWHTVKKELTVEYELDGVPLECWSYHPSANVYVLPRAYGLKNFGRHDEYSNCTELNFIIWPKMVFSDDGGFRPGQVEAIHDTIVELKAEYGACLEAPCGSGKSIMALAIAAYLGVKTLVVVHKEDLAVQFRGYATQFFPKIKLGHIQSDTCVYGGCHLTTALAQTLFTRKEYAVDLKDEFGLVIYDEAHRYPARVFQQVLSMFNCRYRLGISATWERKDGLQKLVHWHIGDIAHVIQVARLVGRYYQPRPGFAMKYGILDIPGKSGFPKFLTHIGHHQIYNDWLAYQVIKSAGAGRKTLVVSDRTVQLEAIRTAILKAGSPVTVGMYVGKDKSMKTKAKLDAAKECDVILSTYGMVNEGTDIPELDTLIFATPRSEVEQVVGRIQRICDGKKELVIVDPVLSHGMLIGMGKKRKNIYDKLGFKQAGAE